MQIQGCHVVSMTDPCGRNLGFLDRSRYFSSKHLLNCTYEAEWSPFQTHYFSENLVPPGIVPGPLNLSPEKVNGNIHGISNWSNILFAFILWIIEFRSCVLSYYIILNLQWVARLKNYVALVNYVSAMLWLKLFSNIP
jgi:hypothetical protein